MDMDMWSTVYSLVPEGERLVAILANSCKRFLLGHCDGLRDRSMAKAAAFARPALRDKMRMSVEGHREERELVNLALWSSIREDQVLRVGSGEEK